jgi:formylglycine-generating enzyme required for sulfatase activity
LGCKQGETVAASPGGEVTRAPLVRFALFRGGRDGTPFFLDRFELTRREVREYYQAQGRGVPDALLRIWQFHETTGRADALGDEDSAASGLRAEAGSREDWPASGVTLAEAQSLAAWRLGRLPTVAEWAFATGSAVGYRFPWGDTFRGYLCNTDELNLGRPTAVGTFDPGGYSSGHAFCFDLIGNLAELVRVLEPERSLRDGEADAPPDGPAEEPAHATWLAVGWHYQHRYKQGENPVEDRAIGPILPGDRDCQVGMRVATDPETFLTGILGSSAGAGLDRGQIEQFLLAYRELFGPALARLAALPGARDPETLRWLCRMLDVSLPR